MMVVLFACYTLALALGELSHGVAVGFVFLSKFSCGCRISIIEEAGIISDGCI